MLIQELKLTSPRGELFLFDVQPGDPYFCCDAYIALHDTPSESLFVGRYPDGSRFFVRPLQPLNAGFHAYPGDSTHFGQLAEQPLFVVEEEGEDGSTQKTD